MVKATEFDGLLDEVLYGMANAELPPALTRKVRSRVGLPERRRVAGSQMLSLAAFTGLRGAERERGPIAGAVLLHLAAMLLLLAVVRGHLPVAAPRVEAVTAVIQAPVRMRMAARRESVGGGGGQRGATPVTRGHLPRMAESQVMAPTVVPVQAVKIQVEPTLVVQREMTMASAAPDVGMPSSPLVGLSLGNGQGTGMSLGNGAGLGLGSGGNVGGGLRRVGGGVMAPVLLHEVEPEFTEEARRAKVAGNVLVSLIVGTDGRPVRVHVLRGIGMGLDEKAMEAVRQYRFKPAMEKGRAVPVEVNVDVEFQIF